MNRMSIFLTGKIMFYAQQKKWLVFDPKRVLNTSKEQIDNANAFWYTGLKATVNIEISRTRICI